ncbi:hypothetical protein DFH09DRAFT_1084742 [Mycena vulgaris]|nr:hypothetical protein DFH09DRAFT_1084742 [Mycena vulgaris]
MSSCRSEIQFIACCAFIWYWCMTIVTRLCPDAAAAAAAAWDRDDGEVAVWDGHGDGEGAAYPRVYDEDMDYKYVNDSPPYVILGPANDYTSIDRYDEYTSGASVDDGDVDYDEQDARFEVEVLRAFGAVVGGCGAGMDSREWQRELELPARDAPTLSASKRPPKRARGSDSSTDGGSETESDGENVDADAEEDGGDYEDRWLQCKHVLTEPDRIITTDQVDRAAYQAPSGLVRSCQIHPSQKSDWRKSWQHPVARTRYITLLVSFQFPANCKILDHLDLVGGEAMASCEVTT